MYFTFITVRDNKLKIGVGWGKLSSPKNSLPPPPPPHRLYFFCITSPIFFRYISEPPLLPSPFRQPNLTRNKTNVSFVSGERPYGDNNLAVTQKVVKMTAKTESKIIF